MVARKIFANSDVKLFGNLERNFEHFYLDVLVLFYWFWAENVEVSQFFLSFTNCGERILKLWKFSNLQQLQEQIKASLKKRHESLLS
jgi:hypothetical protein